MEWPAQLNSSIFKNRLKTHCNEVSRYGKKEAGTRRTCNNFNNKINKHKWKTAAPHGRLPHTKHKLKSRPGPLSSSTVVTPHLTLPKLLRGTRDRWVVQVSFITNYSTGLAPFPRLSAPPHSSHTSLPSLFDRLTLALSILILFFKKNTNTSFSNLFVFYLCFICIYYLLLLFIKNLLRVLC